MSIKLATEKNLEVAILEVRGSLVGDEETDQLKSQAKDLIEQGNRKLVIDLAKVDYINSAGIGALIHIHNLYKTNSGKIKLCNLSKGVHNTFVIMRLTSVIEVEESRKGALENF